MILTEENRNTVRKMCLSAILSTTNPSAENLTVRTNLTLQELSQPWHIDLTIFRLSNDALLLCLCRTSLLSQIPRALGFFPGGKAVGLCEVNHSPPSRVQVMDEWNSTSTPPYVFML